ncbi:MAG: hypothetical protein AMXMBFR4_07090 [Candidatus Hydrogenedentota bacterium]
MPIRVAFVGFRHGHSISLYRELREHPGFTVVAACEEDAEAAGKATEQGAAITHDRYETMLSEVDCDAVACGDYYGIRGGRLIQALEYGRHVIADKPLCTRLAEIDRIETLANAKHLKVGCMLPLPYHPPYVTARRLIREGAVGAVHSVTFNGAHALNRHTRPAWVFEPDKYGGTINDIAIHGIDLLPWLTGRSLSSIVAARTWNARLPEHPGFHEGAVCMLSLDNGGSVLGDVSWLSADGVAYGVPVYWRVTILGTAGVLETNYHAKNVMVCKQASSAPEEIPNDPGTPAGYLDDFLADCANEPVKDGLDTPRAIQSARITLQIQAAADAGTRDVSLLRP